MSIMPSMNCPNCGNANPPGKNFCTHCGAQLVAAAPQPASRPAAAGGITGSLQRLGLPVRAGQVLGLVVAVLAGIIVARLMPFIYPIFFARLLDFVFGPGPSTLRDGMNTFLMTLCTFGASFLVAFFSIFRFQSRKSTRS